MAKASMTTTTTIKSRKKGNSKGTMTRKAEKMAYAPKKGDKKNG